MEGAKGKLLKGAAWLSAARIIVNLTAFVSTVILARFLTPDDFGLVALVIAISAIMAAITELSLSQVLIHKEHPEESDYHTVWTLNFIRAVVIASIMVMISFPVSWLYGDQRLIPLLAVLAMVTLIGSIENPKLVSFQRDLVFRQDFLLKVSDKLTAFIFAISIAIYFRSYWALVLGAAAAQILRVILSFAFIKFRPRFSLVGWRDLLSFSIWLTLGRAIQAINQRSIPLIIGLFLPTASVGQYSLGDRVATLPVRESVGTLQQALFPAFARMRDDKARLKAAYLKAQGIIALMALPIGAGMAVVAEPLVLIVLQEKWLPAVPIIQAISLCTGIMAIQNVRPIALALGQPKAILGRDIRAFIIQIPLVLGGLAIGQATSTGAIQGLALALGLSYLTNTFLNLALVKKIAGFSFTSQLAVAARPVIAVSAMAATVLLVQNTTQGVGEVMALAAQIMVGGIVYVTTLILLWIATGKKDGGEKELFQIAGSVIQKYRPVSVPNRANRPD